VELGISAFQTLMKQYASGTEKTPADARGHDRAGTEAYARGLANPENIQVTKTRDRKAYTGQLLAWRGRCCQSKIVGQPGERYERRN
jgi:hypothetical protein